jgi:S1-C subfamily serine protease
MMRENESDDGDGWPPRHEACGPWARDPGPDPWYGSPPGPPAAKRRRHIGVYLAAAVLAAGVGAGLTLSLAGHGAKSPASIASRDLPSPLQATGSAAAGGTTLDPATVQRKVEPGLVDITASLKYQNETAEGTGMILSADGLVLTNNHVIDGATQVRASLIGKPGQSYPAQVLGYDASHDVALLKLTGAAGLATVSPGDSTKVDVGIAVLALGDAEGRGGITPAQGMISALDRSIQASDAGSGTTEDLSDMLETTARIQQGDSGGALANSAGEVIGMVTAANTPAHGQPGGAGFAIPINTALAIVDQIAGGKASATISIGLPGYLGVDVAQSTSADPQQQAADTRQPATRHPKAACVAAGEEPDVPAKIAPAGTGALIVGVVCGSPAQGKGLATGDVITSVNGQRITTPRSLTTITATFRPGTVVSVSWRAPNGSGHAAKIALGEGPAR